MSAQAGVRSADWDKRSAGLMARASFAVIALWMLATMLAHELGPNALYLALDLPFHFICHRIPERVPSLFGVELPMCSRCIGIWAGLSLSAVIAWPVLSLRALRYWIPIALGLMAIEVITQDLGWHPVFHPTRLLSGLLLSVPMGGAIGGLIKRELA